MKNRMNPIKRAVIILFLFLGIGMCLWLPSKLFAIGDRQKMGEVQSQKAEQIVVQSHNQVSLEEKFKLLYDRLDDLRMISVESKPEEQNRMWEMAKEQISLLKKNKAIPQGLDPEAKKQSLQRYFLMDAKKPEISMYFWTLYIGDEDMEISFGMEEESGKVLVFNLCKFRKQVNEQKIGNGFAAYLQPEINWYEEQMPESYYICYNAGYAICTGVFGYEHFGQYSSWYPGVLYDEAAGRSYTKGYGTISD